MESQAVFQAKTQAKFVSIESPPKVFTVAVVFSAGAAALAVAEVLVAVVVFSAATVALELLSSSRSSRNDFSCCFCSSHCVVKLLLQALRHEKNHTWFQPHLNIFQNCTP